MSACDSANARKLHAKAARAWTVEHCPAARRRLLLACLILLNAFLLFVSAELAHALNVPGEAHISVAMSRESAAVTAAEWVEFQSVLRNDGATATPPLVAHLAIAAVDKAREVDPEDWSTQRTQHVRPLQPGESVQLGWKLRALIDGTYAAFVTVVSAREPFPSAVSAPVRLQVAPDDILPLQEVVPVAAVVPLCPLALLVSTVIYKRRKDREAQSD